jgi:hypothetical protein
MAKEKMSERLLSLEKTNSDYRDKFEKEVRAMYEKKLSIAERIVMLGLGVISFIMTMSFFMVAIMAYKFQELEVAGSAVLKWPSAIGGIVCIFWLILSGWLLIRGKVNILLYHRLVAILGWLLILHLMFITIVLFFMLDNMGGGEENVGPILMFIYVVFLPLFTLQLLQSGRQERMRLKMQQKILELEFQIAQLRE